MLAARGLRALEGATAPEDRPGARPWRVQCRSQARGIVIRSLATGVGLTLLVVLLSLVDRTSR